MEIMHVILSASFGSLRPASQILSAAKDDMQAASQARSREVFSPNVLRRRCMLLVSFVGEVVQ
ncbi:MAG: hypothetical protein AUF64_01550 [Chloroflexi bacterium 13_1_20CM_54_36]|nr:MAG: hypothetical protein AUH05_21125 [Ktedonobacter sp. 13_2_20CM_53_11]OLB57532.1 MAG: hypothetical protein AUI01_04340 [Ktedonobacter sp. 13_2_20CM_2_56_8]OLD84462.1 MAG: hypothetical protein AUF64_01550 [Chloroflexi bacterium 13_1_20CM_54_36]